MEEKTKATWYALVGYKASEEARSKGLSELFNGASYCWI